MSTQKPLTKVNGAILLLSGAYLFFITLVIAPYLNIALFSSVHTTTKLLLVTSAGCVGLLQLFFLVPRIPRLVLQGVNLRIRLAVIVSLLGLLMSVAFSASPKTSLFGMFTLWEQNVMISLVYLILFAAWYVYFVLLRSLSLEKTVFHTLMTLAVAIAVVYSLGEYFLWEPSTGYTTNSVTRISLGFKNPLLAAYFLGMLWSYSAARFLSVLSIVKNQSWVRATNAFIQLLLFGGISLALLLTFTRSAWIAAGLTFAVDIGVKIIGDIAAARKKQIPGYSIKFVILQNGIAFTILCAIVVSLGYQFRNEIALRNTDLTAESQNTLATIAQSLGKTNQEDALVFYQQAKQYSSMDIRLLEWKWGMKTWSGSLKSILFGTGPDAGFFEMPKYRDPIFNNFPTDAATKPFYVRNLYINFLMQFGLLVTLATIYLVIVLAKKLFPILQTDLVATSILLAFFAQGLFYYSSHIPTVLAIFVFGYLLALASPKEVLLLRNPNVSERFVLLFLVMVLLFWIVPIAQAEFYINRYAQSGLPAKVSEMQTHAQLAINNNVLKRFLVYHYSDTPEAQLYLSELETSNDVDDLRIAGDAYYILARKNESGENAEKSIEILQKLLEIDPTLPATWDGLGLRYLYIGKFVDAKNSFFKAIDLKPDYWYAYLHLGEVSRQQCNPKEALTWYEKAEEFVPSAENEIKEAEKEIKTPRAECK